MSPSHGKWSLSDIVPTMNESFLLLFLKTLFIYHNLIGFLMSVYEVKLSKNSSNTWADLLQLYGLENDF